MNYKTTKNFTDWLKPLYPDFTVEVYETATKGKYLPIIDLEDLHDILWELFDVENPEYPKESRIRKRDCDKIKGHLNAMGLIIDGGWISAIVRKSQTKVIELTSKTVADELWRKYTAGKESLWKTNPDEVLKDIMKTYKELNQ